MIRRMLAVSWGTLASCLDYLTIRRPVNRLHGVAAGEGQGEALITSDQEELVRIRELAAPAARVAHGVTPAGHAAEGDGERALGAAGEQPRAALVAAAEVGEVLLAAGVGVDPAHVVGDRA